MREIGEIRGIFEENKPKKGVFSQKTHKRKTLAFDPNMCVDVTRFERWNVQPY